MKVRRWRLYSTSDQSAAGDGEKKSSSRKARKSVSERKRNGKRTRGSRGSSIFGGNYSGEKPASDHTGMTMIEPISSDEEVKKKKKEKRPSKEKRKHKKRKKGRLKNIFCFSENEAKQENEDRNTHHDSFEMTQNMDSYELSQEDIAEWVREQRTAREQRTKAENEKYNLSTLDENDTSNITKVDSKSTVKSNSKATKVNSKASKTANANATKVNSKATTTKQTSPAANATKDNSKTAAKPTTTVIKVKSKASAEPTTNVAPKTLAKSKSNDSPSDGEHQHESPELSKRSSLASQDELSARDSFSSLDSFSAPASNRSILKGVTARDSFSSISSAPASNRSIVSAPASNRSILKGVTARDSFSSLSSAPASNRSILKEMSIKATTNKPKESQSCQTVNDKSRKKANDRRKKTDLDITGHTSTSVDSMEPKKTRKRMVPKALPSVPFTNERRKYPSKKNLRKKSFRSSGSSSRNNSFTNRIDFTGEISASIPDSCPSVIDEMQRLGSLVDLMMTRMELYEKQSDCLVHASLAYNEQWKKANEEQKAKNEDKKTSKKKKKATPDEHPSPGTVTKQENLEQWITKLEGIEKAYQERLALTKTQLKVLKDDQAATNKRIIAGYEDKMKGKHTEQRNPKDEVELDYMNQSRSNRSITNRSRSRSSQSRSIRSLSSGKLIDEESSLWDSGHIDCALDIEDSCHTMSTRHGRNVKFNPTVSVATTLSRHDMDPNEKFCYWAGDGDDDMTEEVLKMMTEKWIVRKQIDEVEEELSTHSRASESSHGGSSPPSELIADEIKKLLPPTEREGHEGYTYTIGIQG